MILHFHESALTEASKLIDECCGNHSQVKSSHSHSFTAASVPRLIDNSENLCLLKSTCQIDHIS